MSGAAPPSYLKWTEEYETALCKLETDPICIKEIALCILKEQHKKEMFAILRALSKEKMEAHIKEMTGSKRMLV